MKETEKPAAEAMREQRQAGQTQKGRCIEEERD